MFKKFRTDPLYLGRYYTHQKEISAQQEKYLILNLNSSLWERIRNYLTIGIYSHKDHHDQPQVFNPLSTNKES